MPKVPVWDRSTWPTPFDPKKKPRSLAKGNVRSMKREIKPREREIVNELASIKAQVKALKTQARALNTELNMVRGISTFGANKVSLYALRLEGDCWYVGMSYNVDRRFAKHSKGKGAAWTKRHVPIAIHERRLTPFYSQEEAAKLEDDMTLEYALKYGSDKVRGGGWCQTKPRWPDVIVQNESAFL